MTGAGLLTAFGKGWEINSAGFRSGLTKFRPVTLFDVSAQRVKVAAEVDLPDALPATHLHTSTARRLERASRLLLWSAHEALTQANWAPRRDFPVVLGTTSGGMTLGQDYYRQAMQRPRSQRLQPSRVSHYLAQRPGLDLLDAFQLSGPVTVIANACASGANAIGHAWDLVRRGHSSRALAGGYDALSQLVFSGFDSLQALSPTCCRPFDAARDGLALGEGAAVLAMESLAEAQRRGAAILGEIVGYGAATDIFHLTQPQPQGEAAFEAMTGACRQARLDPEQIGYVNAHGTGTPLNDSAEAAALSRWAGRAAHRIAVSSTKASIGHLLGAAGAVEALVCLMALQGQWLPPTRTVKTPDPAVNFPLVREPAAASLEYAMTNSFGFGGANATLIFRRWG